MNVQPTYTIKQLAETDCMKVVTFMMTLQQELFPMQKQQASLTYMELEYVQKQYINREDAALFVAMTEGGDVIGTIAYLPFDNRFPQLQSLYNHVRTTELVRCYIAADYRRHRIGTSLYETVIESIRLAGYEKIYLHTHPFLPGGLPFWHSKGFIERLNEADYYWKTIHRDKLL